MKDKPLIYFFSIVLVLFIIAIALYPLYSPEEVPEEIICGLENCHGLNIICGDDIPEFCTEIYQIGDKCRKFASCEIIDGFCQPIRTEEFKNCKECVEKCLEENLDNPVRSFACEAEC